MFDRDEFDTIDSTDEDALLRILPDDSDDDDLDAYEGDDITRAWQEGFLGDGYDLSER